MKLRPLSDHVVIRPLEAEAKTAGGIVLPESAKVKQTKGEILSVGTGKVLSNGRVIPPSVKKGDLVIYGQYAGNDVKVEGEELKIISESEILAVISK